MEIDGELKAVIQEHAWKSFSIHADQRMKSFNFFVLLSTLVIGGLFTVLKDGRHLCVGALLSMLLPFFSFVFWKLDGRNRQLVKHAEAALMFIESQWQLPSSGDAPHPVQIFLAEEYTSNRLPPFGGNSLLKAQLRYSHCFNAVFAPFCVGGFMVGIVLLVAAFMTTACG